MVECGQKTPGLARRGDAAVIRIGNLSLPLEAGEEGLRKRAARALGVRPGALGELEIVRQSIDARDKHNVRYVYLSLIHISEPTRPY